MEWVALIKQAGKWRPSGRTFVAESAESVARDVHRLTHALFVKVRPVEGRSWSEWACLNGKLYLVPITWSK